MTGVAFFDIDSFQLEEGVVATEYERPAPAPDYPIEIHSLNDFDIVSSVGRENLLLNSKRTVTNSGYSLSGYTLSDKSKIENGKRYALRVKGSLQSYSTGWYINIYNRTVGGTLSYPAMITMNSSHKVSDNEWVGTFTMPTLNEVHGTVGLYPFPLNSSHTEPATVEWIKLEKLEGTSEPTNFTLNPSEVSYDTYSPTINKINILLDEPLRSVGDVKDRLFRDSDGVWKVERKVGEYIFDGSQGFSINPMTPNNRLVLNLFTETNPKKVYTYKTNMFPYVSNGESNPFLTDYLVNQGSDAYNRFWVYTNRFSTNSEVTQFFKNTPLSILYDMHESEIEILPMSTQDKLNNLSSFAKSNYVYTVDDNNLNPNLNVVFKSKGWKHKQITDRLETDVSNKADRSDVEEGFSDVNESIDEFRRNYESYQDSAAQSMEDASNELQKALERTSIIEANLGEGAADWIFTHTQIRMSDEGVTIGQKEAGSYLQISDNQISFFNGSEDPVAFINGGMLHINHAIFVESIQISEFMISSEISGHITFRYVGGS